MTNYPKGSQGAAEAKSNKIMLAVMAVVTLIVMLLVFVFNTHLHLFANRAGWVMNVLGGLLFVASWVWLYFGAKNDWDAKAGIGWFLLLLAGFVVSTGFNFDYFGI